MPQHPRSVKLHTIQKVVRNTAGFEKGNVSHENWEYCYRSLSGNLNLTVAKDAVYFLARLD